MQSLQKHNHNNFASLHFQFMHSLGTQITHTVKTKLQPTLNCNLAIHSKCCKNTGLFTGSNGFQVGIHVEKWYRLRMCVDDDWAVPQTWSWKANPQIEVLGVLPTWLRSASNAPIYHTKLLMAFHWLTVHYASMHVYALGRQTKWVTLGCATDWSVNTIQF